MRALILSDIHGNLEALEAVLAAAPDLLGADELAVYRASGGEAGLFDQYDNDGYSLGVEKGAEGSLMLSVRVSGAPLASRAAYPTGAAREASLTISPERDAYARELAGSAATQAEAVERIPYMAPTLVGPEKAALGKRLTDCWWHTIVPPGGKERTGYPTQQPLGILRRIVQTSSPPGGLVADFFAGSGTTGVAAYQAGRPFLLVDDSPEATAVMARRFAAISDIEYAGFVPGEQ